MELNWGHKFCKKKKKSLNWTKKLWNWKIILKLKNYSETDKKTKKLDLKQKKKLSD